MWYETISNGMSGKIIPPANATIVTELWKSNSSVQVSTFANGLPNFQIPLTTGGTLVGATLDADGNYVLIDAPALYPIALVYIYEVAHKDFDKNFALFGEVYQGDIGQYSIYKTGAKRFTIGEEYTAPTADNDAAPKKYVDDHAGSGGGVSFAAAAVLGTL
jgi:hypothetical protein